MTEPEAEALLRFLAVHMTQPAFTCRLRWEPKTFALWDNRICIHQAFNDYDGFRRELYRTTVAAKCRASRSSTVRDGPSKRSPNKLCPARCPPVDSARNFKGRTPCALPG